MKVFSELKNGTDGKVYGLRYLLEDQELAGLQNAGIIGDVQEVVGMRQAADIVMADFEKQQFEACGGIIQ